MSAFLTGCETPSDFDAIKEEVNPIDRRWGGF